ncbi:MAG: hypothetical protein IJ568_08075 [Bacilli bacterium]|nr:hypothetical protein [Bacilli bacterium]
MSIKEKLESVKGIILSRNLKDYSEEFDAVLEDQPQEEKDYYRLRYINYFRDFTHENYNSNYEIQDIKLDTFTIPNNFTHEDAIKVLSYLIDYLEEKLDLAENTYRSMESLNSILDNRKLGFVKVSKDISDDKIEDLFLVIGRLLLFKESKDYKKYYNWRKSGITIEEVKEIYKKIGINLDEMDILKEENGKKLVR